MSWLTRVFWFGTILSCVQWLVRWRLAGAISPSRIFGEARRSFGNMHVTRLALSLFALIALPLDIAFDLCPPALIPLQLPLALTVLFSVTAPVSFLVLGASRPETGGGGTEGLSFEG